MSRVVRTADGLRVLVQQRWEAILKAFIAAIAAAIAAAMMH